VLERLLHYASQRYETLRSIREAESRLRSIVEAISDGVLIVDDGGTVLFANPAAETVLMRPLSEILGAGIGFDLPDPSPSVVDLYSHRHDPIRLHVHVGELMWERRPARLVTLRDVTTQVAIEDNLKRARDDAERVANLKTAFLANMSHELRMPLASIIGFAQIIRDGLGDHEFQEFAENIIQSGNRLLETITSVLDLTRLDANAVQSHARPVSVASVAREAVGMLAALATRKGLPVDIEPGEADDTIHADPAVLRRILNNLIGNAIKFTDSGSVTVKIEADSSFVRIHVIDTGTGISPEFIPQLFDEFTQESSGYDRSHEGSGLGLAITRRLCALIGAEIGVESRRGEGSTFTVVVPHADAWTD
jgi:signal transduction histidine kinase